jgi:hypothetical protein
LQGPRQLERVNIRAGAVDVRFRRSCSSLRCFHSPAAPAALHGPLRQTSRRRGEAGCGAGKVSPAVLAGEACAATRLGAGRPRASFSSSRAGSSSSSKIWPAAKPTAVIKPKLAVGTKLETPSKANCEISSSDVANTARPDDSKLRAIANTADAPASRRCL